MNVEQKKLLLDLRSTSYGKALQAFLEEKYKEIGDITTIPNDENIAVETMGRKFALKLLKDLFIFMEEKKPVDKKLNQYE